VSGLNSNAIPIVNGIEASAQFIDGILNTEIIEAIMIIDPIRVVFQLLIKFFFMS
jgi:hypothetical protein